MNQSKRTWIVGLFGFVTMVLAIASYGYTDLLIMLGLAIGDNEFDAQESRGLDFNISATADAFACKHALKRLHTRPIACKCSLNVFSERLGPLRSLDRPAGAQSSTITFKSWPAPGQPPSARS